MDALRRVRLVGRAPRARRKREGERPREPPQAKETDVYSENTVFVRAVPLREGGLHGFVSEIYPFFAPKSGPFGTTRKL